MNNENQYAFQKMQNEYCRLPYNAKRVAATLDALAMTEQMDTDSRLSVLFHLAYAYALGDDPAKALPVCAEFFALLEQCPHYTRRRREAPSLAILALYAAISLPQISLEQCKTLLEEAHQQTKKYGIGDRLWHMHACNFSLITGDLVAAEQHQRAFRAAPRDQLSDCAACEASNAAEFLLELGLREEAEALLQPVLDGALTCEQQPWSALSMLIHDALDTGAVARAQELGQALRQRELTKSTDLTSVGALLHLQAYCDEAPSLALLEKGICWSIGVWDQQLLFELYRGALAFCAKLEKTEQILFLSLPKKFPIWRRDGQYESAALTKWFYTQAKEIADRFDQRNGSDYFSKRIVSLRLQEKPMEGNAPASEAREEVFA